MRNLIKCSNKKLTLTIINSDKITGMLYLGVWYYFI